MNARTPAGITSFLVLRMWFGKAVEDFNRAISKDGSDAPQLIAATSNGFVSESTFRFSSCCQSSDEYHPVVWVGFAFYAVPVVCSLAKLHVAAGEA